MEQYKDSPYDDDLTLDSGEYDDSFYTGSEDLFEYVAEEDSPISRLKGLILSIDWEITDEVLLQFNEELVDLRDVWVGNKINLVYVQALEKISKYIYQRKSKAHPSAIKLLITLYHNLEKIVLSDDLSEEEKKEILLEDVKRFEGLKKIISRTSTENILEEGPEDPDISRTNGSEDEEDDILKNLKAIVLGIDWEITDEDLGNLRQEVVHLEKVYAGSKPKLILLQGIGTLGAYIKHKKSNAHADAFQVLHLFCESLEKMVIQTMGPEEEKAVLLPAVEKFNFFKALLGPTISPESIERTDEEDDDFVDSSQEIAPAFSDIPEDEVQGFQAEEEAKSLGLDIPENVDSYVENFFPKNKGEDGPSSLAAETPAENSDAHKSDEGPTVGEAFLEGQDLDKSPDFSFVDKKTALQGVNVETEADDDSGEEALPEVEGELAPALVDTEEVSLFNEDSVQETISSDHVNLQISETVKDLFGGEFAEEPDFSVDGAESGGEEQAAAETVEEELGQVWEEQFPDVPVQTPLEVDKELALQGVDVETDDDDSDEEPLPYADGELAPALEDSGPAESLHEGLSEDDPFVLEVEAGEEEDRASLAGEISASAFENCGTEQVVGEQNESLTEQLSADLDTQLDSFFEEEEELWPSEREHESIPTEGLEQLAVSSLAEAEVIAAREDVAFELVEDDTSVLTVIENAVAGLGSAKDFDLVEGIHRNIENLKEEWKADSQKRGFLILASALVENVVHSKQGRIEEGKELLASVLASVRNVDKKEVLVGQEILLVETEKVLAWQQSLLRQAAERSEFVIETGPGN